MNARTIDCDLETARIRGLQAIYAKAHGALISWGRWSMDRRGIFPREAKPSLNYNRDEKEDYGEETFPDEERLARIASTPIRSSPADRLPYDEKTALVLDERIHHPGGLGVEVRRCLRIAYATREIPESQFSQRSGCLPHIFCERLEEALRFVGRFI